MPVAPGGQSHYRAVLPTPVSTQVLSRPTTSSQQERQEKKVDEDNGDFQEPDKTVNVLLKPNIIFSDYLLDHNLSLRMDHQFKEDRKTVPTLKISSISPKEKFFRYLPYLYHLFARGRANV
jgi:hypothetical protein